MRFLTDITSKIFRFLEGIQVDVSNRVRDFGAQYIAFGVFGIINYPLFYFIWRIYDQKGYENFSLRLLATVLCAVLLLKNYWPNKLKKWLPVYWYFTLAFCLPFFFFFMLFKNGGENVWLMSSNTILFWLILMVDWASYFFLFSTGFLFAIICFILTTPGFVINFSKIWGIGAQFIASFVVVVFFANQKRKFELTKLKTIQAIGASIAHELRTPLRAISGTLSGISNVYPKLVQTYKLAKNQELKIPYIFPDDYKSLPKLIEYGEEEVKAAFNIIDMLLIKADMYGVKDIILETCSVRDCVNSAIERYPFNIGESELIQFEEGDFYFKGNKLFFIHILFNLIKNSLYYIKVAQKGRIFISCEEKEEINVLIFMDTATGIQEKFLSELFEPFFTKTTHGTGLGLYLCKVIMESFGGNILCESIVGKYTKFLLYFPKVTKNMS